MQYEVHAIFERHGFRYMILAKVEHQDRPASFVYLVSMQEIGSDAIYAHMAIEDGFFEQ